jgi:hypothetical protein
MTTRELINHLEYLIREGKITGATEVFSVTNITDEYGWTDTDNNPVNKESLEPLVIEKLDGKVTQLIIDARWG